MTGAATASSWLDKPVAAGVADQPGGSLPAGTVTFLLTDVEDSTRMWERAPEPMAVAIARHYEIVDDAIVAHHGARPLEQGEGDSVVGAFARASDAVAAALDAQRHFLREAWPEGAALSVRMAIHTGEAERRDEYNYFGPSIIRCARLRAIAHGGQVLVSGSTADVAGDRLPSDASLVDLGPHRLKDLGRPERVFELRHPDLPRGHAQLLSLDNLPTNLPVQLTSFVGRVTELEALRDLLGSGRLLSVNGAGGCGKTRLAVQLAASVLERYPGGVWLAELATVTDPSRVLATIAASLGERDLRGDLMEAIAIRLRDQPTLVILDNCEHLLEVVSTLVDALLRQCEFLTIVATSREPLGIQGETAWRVPSMPAPDSSGASAADLLLQYDAVRLFCERAAKVRPNFRLSDENASVVAQICQQLDGLPLAIELAAARVRSMTVDQIAAGIDDRFRLLTGGARTVMPRQQTLHASVDWSYELLSDRERAVFRRLAVFTGGFSLDAAERVAADGFIEPVEVLELLLALVHKSMIDIDDETGRYRMLETLRQYAGARLLEAGEAEAVRDSHLSWAAQRFDPLDILDDDRTGALDAVAADIDNFRTAFKWATLRGDADAAAHFVAVLSRWELWHAGDARAAVSVATEALEIPGASTPQVCMTRAILTIAYAEAGEVDRAISALDEMLARLDDVDDPVRAACLNWAAGAVLYSTDVARAVPLLHDAITAASRAGLPGTERMAHALLALISFIVGAWPQAEAHAANIHEDPRTSIAATNVIIGRQYAACVRGNLDEARALLEHFPPATNPRLIATTEICRLRLDMAQGIDTGAAARLEERLVEARRRGFQVADRFAAWGPSAWRMLHGEPEQGALALVAWHQDVEAPWATIAIAALLTLDRLAEARDELDAGRSVLWGADVAAVRATFETILCRLEGDLTTAEDLGHRALRSHHRAGIKPEFVHTLEALAGIAAAQRSYIESARLTGAAQAMRDNIGYVMRWPYEEQLRDADLAAARAAIGNAAFDAAFTEGRQLDEDATIEYAERARGDRKRPTTGWQSLTPTESNVVRLIATGLTNREVGQQLLMGAETVKTHLSHVYDKLGVHSRAALATEFAKNADLPNEN
jgi:predicted ATPase/class 3 adenylate cyclase/DNA-binding CsgD family transcriptional regulator